MKLPKQTVNRDRHDDKSPMATVGVSPQGVCETACNVAHTVCKAAGIPSIVCDGGLALCLGLC
jgi:hypothetical protein